MISDYVIEKKFKDIFGIFKLYRKMDPNFFNELSDDSDFEEQF